MLNLLLTANGKILSSFFSLIFLQRNWEKLPNFVLKFSSSIFHLPLTPSGTSGLQDKHGRTLGLGLHTKKVVKKNIY